MQVGKTTAADHLVRSHGFVKMALADPIKEIARLGFGWDGAKDARGRRLLQKIGATGRDFDPDLWLDKMAARVAAEPSPRVVIDDVRLAREVDALRSLGFVIVRVERPAELIDSLPEASPSHPDPTETGLEGVPVDHTVENAGTFGELYARLDRLVEEIEEERSPGSGPGDGPP